MPFFIPFKKVFLPGRVKCGGTEGEIVVAHGRQPSPARWAACFIRFCFVVAQKKIAADQLIYRALIYPANYQSSELIDLAS